MQLPTDISLPKLRLGLLIAMIVCVVATAVVITALLVRHLEDPGRIVHHDDLVADLLDWIPATDDTSTSFAVWTPDPEEATTDVLPATEMHGESLGLAPFPQTMGYSATWPRTFGYSAAQVTAWATAGTVDRVTVLSGTFDSLNIEAALKDAGYKRFNYHGAAIYSLSDEVTPVAPVSSDVASDANVVALLGGRLITAEALDPVKAAVDAAQGMRSSLADDEAIATLLRTVAPSNALMVVDAAKQAAACAGDESGSAEGDGRYIAVAYGRIGEGGDRRTLVATSFASAEEAAAAESAYELGWQDGYAVAGSAGAPISTYGHLSNISQSGPLLIAELVDGRENGWTRAAIRYATPVCEAVSGESSGGLTTANMPSEPDDLGHAMESLPDPGLEGATLFADLAHAQRAVGSTAPDDEIVLAGDVESWLDSLGPLPTFDAFPTDGAKLVRWQETFGVPLSSVHAIAETKGSNADDTISVLVGDWDPEMVEDSLTGLEYERVEYGEATIFAVSGNVDDPSHPVNRAAGPSWYNVALIDSRIFLSPSSRRLREIVDFATDGGSDPSTSNGIALSVRLLAGQTDITMGEIVGRDHQTQTCVDLGVSGISPDWQGMAAFWNSTTTGGSGGIVFIPVNDQPLEAVQQKIDQLIRNAHAPGEASSEQVLRSFAESFGYQGINQGRLEDGAAALLALFEPPGGVPESAFFAMGVEGCRFGGS
jgi:hypothetical protein